MSVYRRQPANPLAQGTALPAGCRQATSEGRSLVANNLTRDEARHRSGLISVDSYQVELNLTESAETFRSASTVLFGCARPGEATFIELTAPSVTEITLNGQPVDAAAFDGNRIALPGLAERNELRVIARCAYSRNGEGLHRFTDPTDQRVYLYSDLETFDAHRIYACFDQPDLKATFELTVVAAHDWRVISNMPPDVSAEPAGPGTARWHFPPTPVLPTYITAIAAGAYHEVGSEHDGIPLGIYCRQSLAGFLDPDEIVEITRQGFDFYHRSFGTRYPFEKYDQLFVPEYKSGAMENAGCVTFLEDFVFRSRVTDTERRDRAETILHEMAHMWFGDMVTMAWWDDLWLNESFATWASLAAMTEVTRWPDAWTAFAQSGKAYAYWQDQLPSTHPIAADIEDIASVEVNFDGITYEKGAAVLKQLVAYVGHEQFLAGVRDYFGAHAWANATLADLLHALERQSGRDLTAWSKSWLETAGVNTLQPVYELDGNGTFTSFSVLQDAAPSQPELRTHRIAIGLYDRAAGQLTRRHRVEVDIAGAVTSVPELVGEARPDLILVNDDDLSYAKIRLDEHSLRTAIAHIGEFADSLPATLCWAAAWDMTRDAELSTQDFLALICSGAPSIGQISVLERLLAATGQALRRYADPAWRPQACASFDEALRGWLLAAEPGSDHQLAYAQALAREATTAASLGLLAGLLDGTATVDGLAVDTELRWQFLHRLVSRGLAGQGAVEAELALDPTDAGQRHAQTCLASVPTAAAKEQAWAAITDGSLPNATFRAALRGFADLDQDDLLAPYAERFYAALPQMWTDGASDMAQFFARAGYPASVISQQALDATDAYLQRARPAPALARLLSEGRDDVARALRCRERSVQASRS
jgi:aminopeptidase N